ncbi:MAG: hypothetical protein JSS23_03035 [Proteobacteria bacterium]|nr:hypothetical protein [Pseudomonadota bacterium]
MQIDAIRAASMREVSRELARPTPLEPGRISLLAARHLGNYRSEDVVAFVRALELAHNIKEPLQ